MSSDSESTNSDRSRRWLRKRVGDDVADSGESRRRRVGDDVAEARGFLVRRPAAASLMSAAIPAAVVPTQPGRLYAPWPVGALQRAEPAEEWLRLVRAAVASRRTTTRSAVVLPTRYLPPREVAEPAAAGGGQQGVGGAHGQQECNKVVDLELRLGF